MKLLVLFFAALCALSASISDGATCSIQSTCHTCITAGYCGWNGYSCQSGTSSGPNTGVASIWYWSSCVSTVTTGCAGYYTCSSCIYSSSNCGWDGYLCRSGNGNGPNTGTASTWQYYSCSSTSTFFTVSSWGLWMVIVAFIVFWVFVCSCCAYRRRRAIVVASPTMYAAPLNPGGVYAPAPAGMVQPYPAPTGPIVAAY